MFTSQQLPSIIEMIRSQGRNGDTMLAHITPQEAEMLKQMGGSGTINPNTGLPEFFFPSIISSVFGGGNPSGVLNAFGGGFFKKILSNPETIQKAIIAGLIPSTQAPKAFKQMKDNAMLLPKSPQTNNTENTSLSQQKLDKQEMLKKIKQDNFFPFKRNKMTVYEDNDTYIPDPLETIANVGGSIVAPFLGGGGSSSYGSRNSPLNKTLRNPKVMKGIIDTMPKPNNNSSYALSGKWEE